MIVRHALVEDHEAIFDVLINNGMGMKIASIPPVYFVAEKDGAVIGGAGWYRNGPANIAWLSSVVVDRHFQRQGVGSALVKRATQQAAHAALGAVWLVTYHWNANFYKSLGFEHVRPAHVPRDLYSLRRQKTAQFMRANTHGY